MEKDVLCTWKLRKLSNRRDFKMKTIVRDQGGHYVVIKGSTQQKDVTFVNIYAPNIGASKYIKQILIDLKGETQSNTLIVGDFNTPLTSMGKSARQKISKETSVLNSRLDHMNVTYIWNIPS